MKTAEMMNVRLKNSGQDKQPFAGSDEQPVMQKIESEIKKCHFMSTNRKQQIPLDMLMMYFQSVLDIMWRNYV